MPRLTPETESASASVEMVDENDAPRGGAKAPVEAPGIESASTSIEKLNDNDGPKRGDKVEIVTESLGVQPVTPLHYCSLVLFSIYMLLGTILVVILQFANESQDVELVRVRSNSIYCLR